MSCNCATAAATPCASTVDYSTVQADPALPFIFALDPSSILYPVPGQNQRFVYTITANGADNPTFADLSHFVLTICSDVTEAMLQNVSVTINGVKQTVIIGDNVEILPPDKPDKQTGCAGLKFDFGLNKVNGVMTVVFDLATPHPIGPVTVCVFGGRTALTNLTICGPVCGQVETTCPAVAYQRARVCVPVTITPFASTGDTTTYCCGEATIIEGEATCPGTPLGSCVFTIIQDICVEVPVAFGANATVGDYSVQCLGAGTPTVCEGCLPEAGSVK